MKGKGGGGGCYCFAFWQSSEAWNSKTGAIYDVIGQRLFDARALRVPRHFVQKVALSFRLLAITVVNVGAGSRLV